MANLSPLQGTTEAGWGLDGKISLSTITAVTGTDHGLFASLIGNAPKKNSGHLGVTDSPSTFVC